MIVKEEFLAKLRRYFSLNLYEVKIWTALLSRGVSTAGELSDIANVPRSRTYDVLESLEKKGFIIMKLGKPIKYVAVPPVEVLERVKKKVKEDTDEQLKNLEKVESSDVLRELELLHTQGVELIDPMDLSGSIKGRNNVYNHLESVLKGAEQSISIMTTSEGLVRKSENFKHLFKKLKDKGVKIRVAAPLTKEALIVAKELKPYAEVRHVDKIRSRFTIVDNKELVFMLLDDDTIHPTYDVGIWLNTEFFSKSIEGMFDYLWKDMKTTDQMVK